MSEFISTDINSFNQYLVREIQSIWDDLPRRVTSRQNFNHASFFNALHLIKDVELYHAEWVDEDIEENYEAIDISEINNENRWRANIINFCLEEIIKGNINLINNLACLELQLAEENGIWDYIDAEDADNSNWFDAMGAKMESLLYFISPPVPDSPEGISS